MDSGAQLQERGLRTRTWRVRHPGYQEDVLPGKSDKLYCQGGGLALDGKGVGKSRLGVDAKSVTFRSKEERWRERVRTVRKCDDGGWGEEGSEPTRRWCNLSFHSWRVIKAVKEAF